MSTGSAKPRIMCRLSPNEEAALLRQQKEERRRARLLQVRDQEKSFAKKVRNNVKTKKQEERRVVEGHLRALLAASEEAELRELEARYNSRQKQIGQGHRAAQHIIEEENRLLESKLHLKAEQRLQAKQRHNAAMKELTNSHIREVEAAQHPLMARKKALEVEKERARHVAVHKPHPTQPLIKDLTVGKGHRVQLKEAEGFASTYYNIPTTIVQRVAVLHQGKPSAQDMAKATMAQDESFTRHSSVAHQEQQEKAWLRHKHALAKVKLEREKADVITQLKALEREDRVHRQKTLTKMPANMFQHTQRRMELGHEQQRDMEQAFEGLFIKTHGVHSHQSLSKIASATRQDRSAPSPSDTSHSTTTEDSTSSPGQQDNDQPRDNQPPLKYTEAHPSMTHSLMDGPQTGTSHKQAPPPVSQHPLTQSHQSQAGVRDRSLPSMTILSTDLSSFQQNESSPHRQPTTVSSQLNGFPPNSSPGTVRVPCGEQEASEQSLETSATSASDSSGLATPERSSPRFQRVEFQTRPVAPKKSVATSAGAGQHRTSADVVVSEVTDSELQDLTSTTSRSDSSEGEPRPPIKGILKHTAGEKRTTTAAQPVAASKDRGIQKLVTMIRAQHQAWNERLSTRATLLQSTTSHDGGTVNTQPSAATSLNTPSLIHGQVGGGALHQAPPTSTNGHDESGDVSQHYPTASHDYKGGGATHSFPHLSSHDRKEGGAKYPYSSTPPSTHHQEWGGVSSNGAPPTSMVQQNPLQQNSLSIYTLSTRDSTVNTESDSATHSDDASQLQLPSAMHGGSTLQTERGTVSPEPLSITQYHTTVDTLEATCTSQQPPWPQKDRMNENLYHVDVRSPQSFQPHLMPATTFDEMPPTTKQSAVILDPSERGGLRVPSQPRDVRVQPCGSQRYSGATFSPTVEPRGNIDITALSSVMALSANVLEDSSPERGYGRATLPPQHHSPPLTTLAGNDLQSHSPTSAPAPNTSAPAPFHSNASAPGPFHSNASAPGPFHSNTSAPAPFYPSTSAPGPFHSNISVPVSFHSNWSVASPLTLSNAAQIPQIPSPRPLPTSNIQYPFPFHQGPHPYTTPFTQLSGSQPHTQHLTTTTTAISAIPTPKSPSLSPSPLTQPSPQPSQRTTHLPDFHQLSLATPVAPHRDASGLLTTPLQDLSLQSTVGESPLQLRTTRQQHQASLLVQPYPFHVSSNKHGVADQPYSELAAVLLQPPTNIKSVGATTEAEKREATIPGAGLGVVHTQLPAENLSIITLETSHTRSDQPASTRSSSCSPVEESQASSRYPDHAPESGDISLPEDRHDNVRPSSSSGSETDESEQELREQEHGLRARELREEAIEGTTLSPHEPLSSVANAGSDLEETARMSSVHTNELKGVGRALQDKLVKAMHLCEDSWDEESSESDKESDTPANSANEQFAALPDHSSSSSEPEADENQSNSSSLVDGSNSNNDSSSGSQFGVVHSGSRPLTLQEAFLRRKEQFILKSRERLQQLKANAEKRQVESSPTLVHGSPRRLQRGGRAAVKQSTPQNIHQQGRRHLNNENSSKKSTQQSSKANRDARKRGVTFSSPLAVPQDTGRFSPPQLFGACAVSAKTAQPPKFISSQAREKIRKKEMKERNLRFYNRLPEVKKQREEEKRKRAYSANRDKAKEYHEKLRVKVKLHEEKKHIKQRSHPPTNRTQTKPNPIRPPFR